MFLSISKKNNVHPCKPQFCYIKVRFKGVNIIYACFRDDNFKCSLFTRAVFKEFICNLGYRVCPKHSNILSLKSILLRTSCCRKLLDGNCKQRRLRSDAVSAASDLDL